MAKAIGFIWKEHENKANKTIYFRKMLLEISNNCFAVGN